MSFDLLRRGEPDRVATGVVSPNFFDVLGIKPLIGRTFIGTDDDQGAEAVLVLGHAYWRTKFGGDPNIIGQVFQMNDRPHTVVGVFPSVPHYPNEVDVYMPTSACPFRSGAEANRGDLCGHGIGWPDHDAMLADDRTAHGRVDQLELEPPLGIGPTKRAGSWVG